MMIVDLVCDLYAC